MSRDKAAALIEHARRVNAKRSAGERKVGFKAPEDGPPDVLLRTVIIALLAGLQANDWTCVAEAYVMAGDLHRIMTGENYRPEVQP